jgi:anti-sigma factor RsiW
MNCEEFELIGLDAERDATLSEVTRAAAREHSSTCSRCAALQDSWQAARFELRALAEDAAMAQAPARVEMRLRQEFRTQHVTLIGRRTAVAVAWALAAAAVLAGAVSWRNWRRTPGEEASKHEMSVPSAPEQNPANAGENLSAMAKAAATPAEPKNVSKSAPPVTANEEDAGTFTLLPGNLPAETEDAAIVRVRMQRGALGALGLPVNEERAGEWIQVDLLVGNDGLPQAVRLAR